MNAGLFPVSSPRQLIDRVGTHHASLDDFTQRLYEELRGIASRSLRKERAGHTLRTTALVHEAYVRLASGPSLQFESRVHFLAIASRVMRQVLVDYARARGAQKRGAGAEAVADDWSLSVAAGEGPGPLDLAALDRALTALAVENADLAALIEMRYFGGMTASESAEAMNMSVHVVRHDIRLALAWLRRHLTRRR